jgi:acyl carrier protein
MERETIIQRLTDIFRNIFNDESLIITNELTANDVERWDSLSHMLMIAEVETQFSIRFKLKELNKMRNVGDMIDFIIARS